MSKFIEHIVSMAGREHADKIAHRRPLDVKEQVPAVHGDNELRSVLAEVAYAEFHGFPLETVTSGGDPGWDFCHGVWLSRGRCSGTKVDVKTTNWFDSWIIKDHDGILRADYYVLTWVTLPNSVVFRFKVPTYNVRPIIREKLRDGTWQRFVRKTHHDDILEPFTGTEFRRHEGTIPWLA